MALAALLAGAAWRIFLDAFEPDNVDVDRCYPSADQMRACIDSEFAAMDPSGNTAAECWEKYRIKLRAWHMAKPAFERFLACWGEIRNGIERLLVPAERGACILARLGAPLRFNELDPPVPEERVRFTFLNAPLMRRRLTLGDLLLFLGWDREELWDRARTAVIRAVESARFTDDPSISPPRENP